MAYCTPDDVYTYFLGASALAHVSGRVAAACEPASQFADSIIGAPEKKRFVPPLLVWPDVFRQNVAIIAGYRALTTGGGNPGSSVDESARQQYLDAVFWLQQVRDGEALLDGAIDSSTAGSPRGRPPTVLARADRGMRSWG